MHNGRMNPSLRLLSFLLVLLLAACGSVGGKRTPLDQTLYDYVSAIRWSEFELAEKFVDPEHQQKVGFSDLDRERYKQFQVAGYEVKSGHETGDGLYEQVVEIRFVNRNTQVEKLVTDRQRWRWDPEAGRWWLASGLPDLGAGR